MGLLDTLRQEDNEFVSATLKEEFGYILQIGLIYPNLDTKKWRMISVVFFLISTFLYVYNSITYALAAWNSRENHLLVIQCFHYAVLQFSGLLIIYPVNLLRPEISRLFYKFGKGFSFYDDEMNEFKTKLKTELKRKISLFKKVVTIYFILAIVLLLIIAPLLDLVNGHPSFFMVYNERGVSVNVPIPAWSPFGSHTVLGFCTTAGLQMLGASSVAACVIAGNIFLMTSLGQLTLEFRLLQEALQLLPFRATRLFHQIHGPVSVDTTDIKSNRTLSNCYKYCLKQNVIHYHNIKESFKAINNIVSISLFTAYSIAAIAIALSAVAMLSAEGQIGLLLTSLYGFTGEILQIFFFSWCGEDIQQESENLRQALYSTNWMHLGKEETLMIRIMIEAAKKTCTLNGCCLIDANYQTFANITVNSQSFLMLHVLLNILIRSALKKNVLQPRC